MDKFLIPHQLTYSNELSLRTRKMILSLLIGGLFYSSASAWADCNETLNNKGGIDFICTDTTSPWFDRINYPENNTITLNNVSGGFISGTASINENKAIQGNTIILNGDTSLTGGLNLATIKVMPELSGEMPYDIELVGRIINNHIILNNNSFAESVIIGTIDSVGSSITGNTITLNGSSQTEKVSFGDLHSSSHLPKRITNNTLNINDNASITGSIDGGEIYASPGHYDIDSFTGNTLNFAAAPITLSGDIMGFEKYNFTLDPSLANMDKALITAQAIYFGTDHWNYNPTDGEWKTSKVEVTGIKSGYELSVGDKLVLVKADVIRPEVEVLNQNSTHQQGIVFTYDVNTTLDLDHDQIIATITGKSVNSKLKALSEGHLASSMMLNRGADTLAYDTISSIQKQNNKQGIVPFINLSSGKTRYNSGSHIDAKDGFLTGGLSYQTDQLTSAVLIESGWGSYTTHNSFSDLQNIKGDGHNNYVGVAVVGNYDFDSGVAVDGSLRGGKNHNTYETAGIQNLSTGEYANYKLNSNYIGAHIGTNYSKALDENNIVNVSAKYLWTQLKGKTVNVAGDNFKFDDINSQRIRLDSALSHQYTPAVALRAGLGYEYEFDGKAKASTYSYNIPAPGVKGSTGILTLGSTVKPLANQAFSVDINLDGYTGKRDGFSGGLQLSYAF